MIRVTHLYFAAPASDERTLAETLTSMLNRMEANGHLILSVSVTRAFDVHDIYITSRVVNQ